MWDTIVPDDQIGAESATNGCSDAVAREAAPSSADVNRIDDIVQRMPSGAVNLSKVASRMGRGPIQGDVDGESENRRLEDAQEKCEEIKTSDVGRSTQHRGSKK